MFFIISLRILTFLRRHLWQAHHLAIYFVSPHGESHGKGIGVVVDGCPAGLSLCEEDIQKFLDRRKPGQSKFTTQRRESDTVEILSGIFEGKTTGTPISMMVWNKDQHSADYSEIASYYRPGHADFCFDEKYGFRDYRGGGRSSGRETIGRVAGGAIAIKILEQMDISILAYSQAPIWCPLILPGLIPQKFQKQVVYAGCNSRSKSQRISRKMFTGTKLQRWHHRMSDFGASRRTR